MGGNSDLDGTFRLWSEDLHPSNVLIDRDLRVVAVVDWEFAYVAPSQFTFDPPWWLLLAQRMRESWEANSWMANFASRRSWSFDALFWRYLDPAYFGPNGDGDYKARLGLLSSEEARAMEPFVRTKMEEAKERVSVVWEQEKAMAHLAKVLI